ncbi:MAG TPA: hypothetical protein ENJ39_01535, partial [Flammeovirgaceae bacterium]|nr:hypothetical protein [Flammeovirgaceae bacterium]
MKSTSAMNALSFRYRIGIVIAVILLVAVRPAYGQITGNNNVCINNTYSYSGPTASTYSWSVNGGGTITSSSTTQWIQIKWTQAGTWTIYLSTSTSSGGGGSPPGRPGPGGQQGYVDEVAMPFANTMLGSYTYTVTVNNNVTAGSIGGTQWVCSGGNPTTLNSVSGATGGGSVSYQWQKSTSGASSGFSNISGATGASYDPPGGLTQTTWYRRRAHSSLNCGPDVYSNAVKVSVYALPTAGSIGLAGNSTICYNTDPGSFYNNVSPTGGGQHNYQWQKSTTSATSGFSNISGATSLSYNPGKLTQTTWFRRRVQTPCGTKYSNVIKITVYGQLKAGSISQPAAICAGATPAAINNVTSASGGTNGSYQWYRSTSSASSGFSAINGATGASYQPPALTVPTWYRRTYSSGAGCGSTSVTVKVTVNPLPAQPAAISVSTNTCGNKTLTRGTPPSDVTWYWQGTNANGYSTANSSATYTASANGTYYLRAYDNNSECWSASSSSVSVTVNPYAKPPTNPVITANAACGPKTIDASGFEGATVYWQTSPSGTSTAHPSPYTVPTSGTYYARSVSAAGCWSQLQVPISVTVNTIPATYTLSYSGDLCDLPRFTGTGADFTLSGSQQGVNYQRYLDGQPKDSVRSGTGAALVWNDIWDEGT